MRRRLADWSAGVLAVVVLALGGLVVVKPALDNWDALYRANPFDSARASAIERVLGPSGLLLVRLSLVAFAAFALAAVLQRVILADYRFGPSRTAAHAPSEPPIEKQPVRTPRQDSNEAEIPDHNRPTAPELGSASLAPPIAKLISSRREGLGLSQRELAKRAGISHTVVSRIEQGEQTPSRKTLERLADALRQAR
jgi:DNA-binding XRE family transcriptional regulator